jgi:hypothetical protein
VTFQQLMASDLAGTFLNTNELAVTGIYTCKGVGAIPFSLTMMPGDIADMSLLSDGNAIDQQRCQFLCSLTAIKAGILATFPLGPGLPSKGDQFAITQQGSVGVWSVESHQEDLGDGCNMWMRYEAKLSTGGTGATRYR